MTQVLLPGFPEIPILHTIQSSCYLTKANNLFLTYNKATNMSILLIFMHEFKL